MMICAQCRTPVSDHLKVCPKCGTTAEAVTAQAPQTKRCPICGVDNPPSAQFCRADGHQLQQVEPVPSTDLKASDSVLSCPACGASYPLTAKFCPRDGTPLKRGVVPSPEGVQPPIPTGAVRLPASEAGQPVGQETIQAVLADAATVPKTETKVVHRDSDVTAPPRSVEIARTMVEAATQPEAEATTVGITAEVTAQPINEETTQATLAAAATVSKPETTVVNQEAKAGTRPSLERQPGSMRRLSRSWLWPAVAGVVLLLVGGAGYLYYAGFFGKDPAKVQMKLDAEVKAQGLDDIHVEVSKDWVVTLSGFVENEADRGRVLGIVESNNDVKEVEDRITVVTAKSSPAKGATESPGAQPPSMRKVEELIKQGTFE